ARVRRWGAHAVRRDRVAPAPALDGGDDRVAAAAQRALVEPADLREPVEVRRAALGDLDEGGVGEDARHRPVALARGLLAPLDELARDRALGGVERVHARQPAEDRVGVALVGDVLEGPAFLAGPPEPAAPVELALDRVGELEQVQDVLARIADLLLAERPRVPAREARALAQA